MTKSPPPDPGPPPPDTADAKTRDAWRRANEKFLAEGFRKGAASPALPPNVAATDRRLQELRREHTKFLETNSPMKASLWLALLRPSASVLHDAEMMRRFRAAQAGGEPCDYTPETPAIIDIGNQQVALALAGDAAAISQIADRIEGKAGLRTGDEGEDDPGRRRQAADIAARVVRQMTDARLGADRDAGHAAKIIDVDPVDISAEKAEKEERKQGDRKS